MVIALAQMADWRESGDKSAADSADQARWGRDLAASKWVLYIYTGNDHD
jgi:hypothetical protein